MRKRKFNFQEQQRIVSPGPGKTLLGEFGEELLPPLGWSFLAAGDAGLTRKVTAHKRFWRVMVKKGKRQISKGIWAPREIIEQAKAEVQAKRSTEAYAKQKAYAQAYREKKQEAYVQEFYMEVRVYLNFHAKYADLEDKLAREIAQHATPVGSGTVARTQRIPVEERAERACIAWMRHQTTAYDRMNIARIKGERRFVRQQLAKQSKVLLDKYRKGATRNLHCPLWSAVYSD